MNATKEEYDSIMKNEIWELAKLLENKIPIGSKWLFKSKFTLMVVQTSLKVDWLAKDIHRKKEYIMRACLHLQLK